MTQKIKRLAANYRRIIVIAVLLVAAMAWNTYAARAQGRVTVLQFGRCLDADANGSGNGIKVQLWDCWWGWNQTWSFTADNSIFSYFSARCLDADNSGNGGNGTKVQLWDCNGGLNQKWNFTLDGNLENQQFKGQCLDADDTNGGNGTTVQLWACWNGPNQKWLFDSEWRFPVHVGASNRCLDADTNTIDWNGTVVQLWDCWAGLNQYWMMRSDGTLVNWESHRCLDADTSTIGGDGTKVQLWDCSGGQNQKWIWQGYGFGTGSLGGPNRNSESNRCLDADVSTIGANGTRVQLWDCTGEQNQFWLNAGMFMGMFPY